MPKGHQLFAKDSNRVFQRSLSEIIMIEEIEQKVQNPSLLSAVPLMRLA